MKPTTEDKEIEQMLKDAFELKYSGFETAEALENWKYNFGVE